MPGFMVTCTAGSQMVTCSGLSERAAHTRSHPKVQLSRTCLTEKEHPHSSRATGFCPACHTCISCVKGQKRAVYLQQDIPSTGRAVIVCKSCTCQILDVNACFCSYTGIVFDLHLQKQHSQADIDQASALERSRSAKCSPASSYAGAIAR